MPKRSRHTDCLPFFNFLVKYLYIAMWIYIIITAVGFCAQSLYLLQAGFTSVCSYPMYENKSKQKKNGNKQTK